MTPTILTDLMLWHNCLTGLYRKWTAKYGAISNFSHIRVMLDLLLLIFLLYV